MTSPPCWERSGRCFPGPFRRGPEAGHSRTGVLEAIATEAGLTAETTGDIVSTFDYPDEEDMVKTMLSAGMVVLAARTSGEEAVRAAVLESLASFRTSTGSFRLENEWHYLIARA